MRRALAATFLVTVTLLAGCARTTEGSVAMTTEPGPALTTRPTAPATSSIPTTTSRAPRGGSTVPDVPAPPNALTMKCSDYTQLDEATQKAVVNAILEQEQSILTPDNIDVAKTLADAVCQFLVGSTVSEVLLGGPVP
ncbi:uncharacterized protein RMCC_6416 [Mycolicibacterium canariasense]|uniref:DUF732 domain-containing protein n=1 Tax=Mycolicibacterium canariasense TaxID=228230 RepID=A0A100WJW7_MYCCR|nr:hypothetical protein [Mycolicibacterium canariasense]MCV7207292.1 hypothetical protein [Mycolicibacterium canariasense]ORV06484.1 hypothetical protein AWB94_16110 [Mycolicibacterium canariasense]GAS99451.1 uncharacterized protein RMCC_6416 [Mycolicibacterium canariasense]